MFELYSQQTVVDTFQFCADQDGFEEEYENLGSTFMCSFDIASLFTNVPLTEEITITLDASTASGPKPRHYGTNCTRDPSEEDATEGYYRCGV